MGGYGWGESVGGGGESAALWCGSRKEEQDMQDLERKAGAGGELGRHTRAARRGGRGRGERKWRGRGRVKGERCVPDSCLLDLSKRELRR